MQGQSTEQESQSNVNVFRVCEKKYKKYKNTSTDFSDVIDFHHLNQNTPANLKKIKPYKNEHGLNIYTVEGADGLFFICNPFTAKEQFEWVKKSLTVYSKPPNRNNVSNLNIINQKDPYNNNNNQHSHNNESTQQLHSETHQRKRSISKVDESDVHQPAVWENNIVPWLMNRNWKDLKSLRWITLGYQVFILILLLKYKYDWTNRKYYEKDFVEFPSDLASLSQHYASAVQSHIFHPEAAIINFYHTDSSLMAHLDDVEYTYEQPIVSISFGSTAVFLIGGKTRSVEPVALFIVIMSGESRTCYHGVPRILENSLPQYLTDLESSFSDPLDKNILEYLRFSRVNINVRQVYHNKAPNDTSGNNNTEEAPG